MKIEPYQAGAFSKKMTSAMAHDCRISPDAKSVAFRFRGDDIWRVRNKTASPLSGEIWVYNSIHDSFKRISKGPGDARSPVWISTNFVAYINSDNKGSRNIVVCDIRNGKESVLFYGGDELITTLSSSKNGRVLLFRRGVDLWRGDIGSSRAELKFKKLIFHPTKKWVKPSRIRERFFEKAQSLSVTENGGDAVFSAGGELFAVKPGKGTAVPVRLCGDDSSIRNNPKITRDGKFVYYIRDCGDKSEIHRISRIDETKSWHMAGRIKDECLAKGDDFFQNLQLSPGETCISWTEFEGRLLVMPLSGSRTIVDITPPNTYRSWEYQWSPNGKWIAVASADKNRNVDVWVIDVPEALKGRKNWVNVSDHFGWDGDPQWTSDSKTLSFRCEWEECGKSFFKVDMSRKISKGCCTLVKNRDEEKKIKNAFPKKKKFDIPKFKIQRKISFDDYFALAFKTAYARMQSRFLGGHHHLLDKERFMRWISAAKNAATWTEFRMAMNIAMGEIDASHIAFFPTESSKKEWPVVEGAVNKLKRRKKIESVSQNRRFVEKATGGRWSYIRLGATNANSYNDFRNDLYRYGSDHEGLIVDMRGNTGGNMADQMITCLMTPPHGWIDWSRGKNGYIHDHMGRIQFSGKLIFLIDEDVGSNGEMFAHAIKTFKRGILIGRPTAGDVLSTENMGLLDLGDFRIPHGIWFNQEGISMENNGAKPDILIEDTPAEWAKGFDSQLKKAVEVANTKNTTIP
jgi:tricorn protease